MYPLTTLSAKVDKPHGFTTVNDVLAGERRDRRPKPKGEMYGSVRELMGKEKSRRRKKK